MTSRFAIHCKGLLLGGLLCLSTWALALPSPKDIEASVQAGQLDRAESQLREVLSEKPSSARAHYELGQVLAREGRYIEAEQALRQAQQLEPSLKFAQSPQQFNDLLAKLGTRTRTPSTAGDAAAWHAPTTSAAPALNSPPLLQRQAPAQPTPSLPWGWLLLGGATVAALALWMRRAATAQRVPTAPASSTLDTQGFARNYSTSPSYPNPYPGVPAGQPAAGAGMGSSVTGAVVGGIAGLAAGYALTKMLETDHGGAAPAAAPPQAAIDSPVPLDSPLEKLRSSQTDFGAFDAGSGAGWDNSDVDTDTGSDSDSGSDNW